MNILLVAVSVIVLFLVFVYIGIRFNKNKVISMIRERDNLDLRTDEGKNRAKVLNKRIDRLYGVK